MGEGLGHEAIAGHCQEDAGLAQHHDQQDRGDASHRADNDESREPGQIEAGEGIGNGRILVNLVVGHHASQHTRHRDIQHGADQQRANDADGQVALGVFRLFRVGGDGVKTQVSEKDHGRASQHATGQTVGP